MKNISLEVKGTKLIIEVDLSKKQGPSKSGKTTVIGTTEGNIVLEDGKTYVGVNVYTK